MVGRPRAALTCACAGARSAPHGAPCRARAAGSHGRNDGGGDANRNPGNERSRPSNGGQSVALRSVSGGRWRCRREKDERGRLGRVGRRGLDGDGGLPASGRVHRARAAIGALPRLHWLHGYELGRLVGRQAHLLRHGDEGGGLREAVVPDGGEPPVRVGDRDLRRAQRAVGQGRARAPTSAERAMAAQRAVRAAQRRAAALRLTSMLLPGCATRLR